MKILLSAALMLCSVCLQAADLTTPHSFSAGTPALASDVNDNFQAHADAINTKTPATIVKVNGQKIGWIYSREGSGMVILSDKGSMVALSTDGSIAGGPEMHNMRAFYESADCSGQPYISTGGVAWEYGVFRNTNPLIFWDSVLLTAYYTVTPMELINANSMMYSLEAGCLAFPIGPSLLYRAMPNDPAVTGFAFSADGEAGSVYLPNLTFEIQ